MRTECDEAADWYVTVECGCTQIAARQLVGQLDRARNAAHQHVILIKLLNCGQFTDRSYEYKYESSTTASTSSWGLSTSMITESLYSSGT